MKEAIKNRITKNFRGVILLLLAILVCQWQIDKQQEVNELSKTNEEVQKKYSELKRVNANLSATNSDYREYMLEECKLIELRAETDNSSSNLPTVTLVEEDMLDKQPMYSDFIEAGFMGGDALFYYPDSDKIRLHFKMKPPREPNFNTDKWKTFKDWTLTCKDPDKKEIKVEKDKTNPNYYYMDLEKKGSYLFKKTYGKYKYYFWVTW